MKLLRKLGSGIMSAYPVIYAGFTGLFLAQALTGMYQWWVAVLCGGAYAGGWWVLVSGWREGRRRERGNRQRRANHPSGTSGGSDTGIRPGSTGRAREGDRAGIIPDSAVPVVGYRTWNLTYSEAGDWELVSCTRDCVWPARQPLSAECLMDSDLPGPGTGCSCGVYAMKDGQVFAGPVMGTVNLWGRVIEHERGWRAQYAYPKRLVVDPVFFSPVELAKQAAAALADRYGVPCEVFTLPEAVAT